MKFTAEVAIRTINRNPKHQVKDKLIYLDKKETTLKVLAAADFLHKTEKYFVQFVQA